MRKLHKTIKAYDEVLSAIEKHKKLIVIDADTIIHSMKNHLFGLELKERFGLNIDPLKIYSTEYCALNPNISIIRMDGVERKISWSDDGQQPTNETLLVFCYSSGAYFFGNHYPEELFNEFFNKLKSYNPKYSDTHNHNLYFSLDNAAKLYNEYDSIVDRYKNKIDANYKELQIAKLKKELKELEK